MYYSHTSLGYRKLMLLIYTYPIYGIRRQVIKCVDIYLRKSDLCTLNIYIYVIYMTYVYLILFVYSCTLFRV